MPTKRRSSGRAGPPRLARLLVPFRRLALALPLATGLLPPAATARAQADTALTFDEAGRVREVTPGIADRLGLREPWWPVRGEYRRATAVRGADGTPVLLVQRPDGRVERLALDDARWSALRLEVDTRVRTAGVPSASGRGPAAVPGSARGPVVADAPSPSASRRSFVLTQTALGVGVFAPLTWLAVDDNAFSPSAAILAAAGSYLLATNLANTRTFTQAQRDLGRDGALIGGLAGWAIARGAALEGNRGLALPALVGALAGDVGGTWLARGGTDGDAAGARVGALAGGLATAGVLAASNGLRRDDGTWRRAAPAIVAAGALAGAPIGYRYTRRAPYVITVGDHAATGVASLLGAVAGGAIAASTGPLSGDRRVIGLTAGAGLGAVAGDLLLSRPYDHTVAEAGTLLAGAAVGGAVAALPYVLGSGRSEASLLGAAAIGGAVGVWGGLVVARPLEGGRRRVGAAASGDRSVGGRVTVDPLGVLYAAARVPGSFSFIRVTF
jgi:hypothetical protein